MFCEMFCIFFIGVLSEQYNTSEFSFQPFFECIKCLFFLFFPFTCLKMPKFSIGVIFDFAVLKCFLLTKL